MEQKQPEVIMRKVCEALSEWLRQFWVARKQKWGDFGKHSGYLDARRFRQEFTPKDGVDYDWVDEYAKASYQRLTQLLTKRLIPSSSTLVAELPSWPWVRLL